MSEMIERVAKALFLSRYPSEVNGDQKTESFWPDRIDELVSGPPFNADGYRDMARAAIEAMREPTKDIVSAHHLVPEDNDFDERAADNWRNLIDAALGKVDA